MKYAELIDKIRKLPQPKIYKNSTEVCKIRGVSLTLWDVITAAVISGLNILIVGEKGEGKTQLALEVNNTYFGGRGTLIRAHPDLKTRDIYTALNLEKLSSAKGDTHQALEIVESVKNPLTILDEVNRVPQITQNQVLSILDGYITVPEKNEYVFFGVNGFHIGLATANLGRSYSGIFPFDPAYLDRSHLIINVDNFPPTTTDLIKIQQQDINPRLERPDAEDYTSLIVDIWKNMSGMSLSLDGLTGNINPALPGYEEVLQAFRITAPYSGILDSAWVKREHHGNPYLALDFLHQKIKSSIEDKIDYIKKAFSDSISGRLTRDSVEVMGEEWFWLEEILNEINLIAHNSPEGLQKEIKEGKVLYTQDFWIAGILHPDQTLFGENITQLTYGKDIGKKIREKLSGMYGVAFATEDGIYIWYEGMDQPKLIFELRKEKFRKKEIKGLAFVRGKLLFAIGNEVYDIDNPDIPLISTSSPVQALTQSGDVLLGAEEEKIWISREGKGKEVMIPWQKKVTAVLSAPVYKLKRF